MSGDGDRLALVLLLLAVALQVSIALLASAATTTAGAASGTIAVAAASPPVAPVGRVVAGAAALLTLTAAFEARALLRRHCGGCCCRRCFLCRRGRRLWRGLRCRRRGRRLLHHRGGRGLGVGLGTVGGVAIGGGHAGCLENAVDEVGLLGSGVRLHTHGRRDRMELIALLALQDGTFELLGAHRLPRLVFSGTGSWDGMASMAWLTTRSITCERVASRLYDGTMSTLCSRANDFTYC